MQKHLTMTLTHDISHVATPAPWYGCNVLSPRLGLDPQDVGLPENLRHWEDKTTRWM